MLIPAARAPCGPHAASPYLATLSAASTGRWEYNATPRSVPWEYTGYTNLCDHRVEDGGLGVASRRAENLVQAGVDAAGWNVRESLKYQWAVDSDKCTGGGPGAGSAGSEEGKRSQGSSQAYERYDPADFCARMRQYAARRDAGEEARGAVPRWRRKGAFNLVVVGDSIQQQLAATLANHLLWHARKERVGWAQWAVNKSVCFDWVPHKPHEHCTRYDFHPDACPGEPSTLMPGGTTRQVLPPGVRHRDRNVLSGGAHHYV